MIENPLVVVPLTPGPTQDQRIYPRTQACIDQLQWPKPLDILYMRSVDDHIVPSPTDKANLYHHFDDLRVKHVRAREILLSSNVYDSILFIESDMIFQPDSLLKLAEMDHTDVAYALYCSRHQNAIRGYYRWLAFWNVSDERSMTYCARPSTAKAAWGKVKPSEGAGLGFTLVKRHVLEKIQFMAHITHMVADDWMFALSCLGYGFKQYHHFGVPCGHILHDGAHAIWPYPEPDGEGHMYRIFPLTKEPYYHGQGLQESQGSAREEVHLSNGAL